MSHHRARHRSRSRSRERGRDRTRHRDDRVHRSREGEEHYRRDEERRRYVDDSGSSRRRRDDRKQDESNGHREESNYLSNGKVKEGRRRELDDEEDQSSRHQTGKIVTFTSDLDDGYFNESSQQMGDKKDEFDEDAMAEIDNFLEEEETDETEEQRVAKLEEERHQRQEEILRKYNEKIFSTDDNHANMPLIREVTPAVSGDCMSSESNNKESPTLNPTSVLAVAMETDEDLLREEVALAQEEQNEKNVVKTFDIFSSSPTAMAIAGAGLVDKKGLKRAALVEGDDPLLQSNWDDGEGYYNTRVGEIICSRYQVLGEVGKGVFSTAIKCIDKKSNDVLVVLKIIRNNDIMRKASEKEIFLLQLIAKTDPQNKKHCVRLLGNMDYRNHVVLAFEAMGMNLRETVKKFGKHVGINVTAVRLYARQLFVALRHLAELKIVHADIKPDNILVSEDLKQVKICDFGSAFRETDTDNDPTPYLQSRFYRAPEIVLGLNYDRMIDLWSVGACLYELFTGHVMFAGRTNNEMLRLQMEFKGKVPNRVIKAHQRSFDILELEPHFDNDFKFKMHDIDPVTNKPIMRLVDITSPKKNIAAILLQSKAGADDRQLVLRLADLLEKSLVLDPSKRATVQEILKHPLFTAK